jgi:hypothetical protein
MSDDQPGPPGAHRDDVPGDRPTEPLTPPAPPPASGPTPPPSGPPTTPVPEPPAGTGPSPAPTWPQPEPPAQEPGPSAATSPYAGQPGYGQPGYGQPGYGQPGYGAPPGYGYGYPAGPPTDGTATAALVIAVVGFFVCPPVGAVVALVMANSAQRRIEASGGRLGGLELAKAARIIAIVELALTALLILGGIIAVAASLGARN